MTTQHDHISLSITLEAAQEAFLRALSGKNPSASTLRAYATDPLQFI